MRPLRLASALPVALLVACTFPDVDYEGRGGGTTTTTGTTTTDTTATTGTTTTDTTGTTTTGTTTTGTTTTGTTTTGTTTTGTTTTGTTTTGTTTTGTTTGTTTASTACSLPVACANAAAVCASKARQAYDKCVTGCKGDKPCTAGCNAGKKHDLLNCTTACEGCGAVACGQIPPGCDLIVGN